MLAGVAVRVAGATPVPERATSKVVVESLSVSDSVLLAAPAVVGAKTTAKVVL
jgi:hypothetical protein